MAGVWKRKSDKARKGSGKWTCWFVGADGKRKSAVGLTDKAKSLALAHKLEADARLVREGLLEPTPAAAREKGVAAATAAYEAHIRATGATETYAKKAAATVRRLLDAAEVKSVAAIPYEAVQGALGAMRDAGKSARTVNAARGALRTFAAWLEDTGRIERAPKWLAKLGKLNEEADRRVVRRALTVAEMDRLLAAASAGVPVKLSRRGYQYEERSVTGPERAAIYRIAIETGFRANEVRTLTAGRFKLDGPEPTITVVAGYAKNGKQADQPITPELAAALRPFLDGKPADVPAFPFPAKAAKLLRVDLKAAQIPAATAEGVVDFHSLRHSFITHLIERGATPKEAQVLARHSTITLTLDRYAHAAPANLRAAVARR